MRAFFNLCPIVLPLTLGAASIELPIIPNQVTVQGAPPLAVPFPLPAVTSTDSTLLVVSSSRLEIAQSVQIIGNGTNRLLRLPTIPALPVGNTTFTIYAFNKTTTNQTSFVLTVLPPDFVSANQMSVGTQNSASWADLSGDGYMDLLLYNTATGSSFQAYANVVGRSISPSILFQSTPVGAQTVEYTDFNGDGAVDVLVLSTAKASLYQSRVSPRVPILQPQYVQVTNAWPFQRFAGAAWADFDGDGDEDLLMTGRTLENAPLPAAILRNDQRTSLVSANVVLPATDERPVVGDFDNDGLPDVVLFNVNGTTNGGVWLNQGDWKFKPSPLTFTTDLITHRIDSIFSAGALDFDGDGELDLWAMQESARIPRSHQLFLWRQHAGKFELALKLEPEEIGAMNAPAWADFDGDGRLDFVAPRLGPERYAFTPAPVSMRTNYLTLYRNAGDSRFLPGSYIYPTSFGAPAAGDFNRDGAIDLWVPGTPGRILTNGMRAINPPPDAPEGLRATVFGSTLVFFWHDAHDPNQTVPLTYNLRVGTRPGANDVIASLALADGTRLVNAPGNNGFNSFRVLNLERLTTDHLYWSVQAVDNGFLGSPWAREQAVLVGEEINQPPSLIGLTNVIAWQTQQVRFVVLDDLSRPENISVRAWSTDPTIVAIGNAEVPFWGQFQPSTNRVLTLSIPGRLGEATVNVVATDGHGAVNAEQFTVTVTRPPGTAQINVILDEASPLSLQLQAASGERVKLERSEDLLFWEPAGEITVDAKGEIAWPVPDAGEPGQRFYRIAPTE